MTRWPASWAGVRPPGSAAGMDGALVEGSGALARLLDALAGGVPVDSPAVPLVAHATRVAPSAARPAARSQAGGTRTGSTSQQVGPAQPAGLVMTRRTRRRAGHPERLRRPATDS